MKNLIKLSICTFATLFALCAAVFIATAPDASAQTTTRFCSLGTDGKVLDAIELNGSAAIRTFTFGPRECTSNVAAHKWLVIEAEFTHVTSGNILFTCTNGRSVATADKTPQICVGAGTCTGIDAGIVSKAVTGSKKWSFRIGIRGYRAWSCIASHDNTPAASNFLTAYAYLTD